MHGKFGELGLMVCGQLHVVKVCGHGVLVMSVWRKKLNMDLLEGRPLMLKVAQFGDGSAHFRIGPN